VEEEFDRTIFIMETGPGPPAGRPRWYCYQHEPGFDDPDEGVAWALTQTDLVMVRPMNGPYYWAGTEPTEWDAESVGEPLRSWPPSDEERRRWDTDYAQASETLAEVKRIAPQLAEAIADRVAKVLPEPWSAEALSPSERPDDLEPGPAVAITRNDTGGRIIYGVADFEIPAIYEEILSQAQDAIAEETTDAWPGGPGARRLWMPDVEIVDDEVRAWFGPKDDPVLVLEPISLAELRR
jgi:hypothetical protein